MRTPLPDCDLLVRADTIITQDEKRRIISNGAVVIKNDIIADIGAYADMESAYAPIERLDMAGKILMPGLVNAHTHLPMTLLRGVADDLPLMRWLEEHIWPVEHQLTEEMLRIGARIGCAELIRTGCTSFLNGYFKEFTTGDEANQAGLRAILGEGFFSFPSPMFPTAEDCWKTIRELHSKYSSSQLISMAVTPHAVFTVKPGDLEASYHLAKDLGLQWQIHLAESPEETAICLDKYGKRPVQLLADLDLLSPSTTLHHCVDVTSDEIAILAEHQANVVHNPASNLKLNSGISPVQEMLDAGVVVGLGTDGASSNNQLNMFREMGLAALIGKVRQNDASAVNAQSVLDMATRGSAKCLGMSELGQISIGSPADLIALDLSSPNMMPVYNPISHLVYASTGHEVCMTMVGGKILYLYGNYWTMDIKALHYDALRAKEWVVSVAKK